MFGMMAVFLAWTSFAPGPAEGQRIIYPEVILIGSSCDVISRITETPKRKRRRNARNPNVERAEETVASFTQKVSQRSAFCVIPLCECQRCTYPTAGLYFESFLPFDARIALLLLLALRHINQVHLEQSHCML